MSFIATAAAAASFCINGLDFKSLQVTIGIKALKTAIKGIQCRTIF